MSPQQKRDAMAQELAIHSSAALAARRGHGAHSPHSPPAQNGKTPTFGADGMIDPAKLRMLAEKLTSKAGKRVLSDAAEGDTAAFAALLRQKLFSS